MEKILNQQQQMMENFTKQQQMIENLTKQIETQQKTIDALKYEQEKNK